MKMMDLWIDFNGVGDDGRATSLLQFAREGVRLTVGDCITVGDTEGNRCEAEVESIDSRGAVVVALKGDRVQKRAVTAGARR